MYVQCKCTILTRTRSLILPLCNTQSKVRRSPKNINTQRARCTISQIIAETEPGSNSTTICGKVEHSNHVILALHKYHWWPDRTDNNMIYKNEYSLSLKLLRKFSRLIFQNWQQNSFFLKLEQYLSGHTYFVQQFVSHCMPLLLT